MSLFLPLSIPDNDFSARYSVMDLPPSLSCQPCGAFAVGVCWFVIPLMLFLVSRQQISASVRFSPLSLLRARHLFFQRSFSPLSGKGPLYRPYGSAWAPNGDLIVSSFKNNLVLRYSAKGKYKGTVGTSNDLLMGPNALLYGKDGLLYLTTEGSIMINGTLQWNFASQILRLKNNAWEVFSEDANRYGIITPVGYPNYLGLANSPVNDNLIFVSDFANGVLAFDLTTKVMKGRIETSFTGNPSSNLLGALIFNPKPKHSRYEIFTPGFLPNQNNQGAILRLRFDQVSKMDKVRPAFEVAPTSRLVKPIAVVRV